MIPAVDQRTDACRSGDLRLRPKSVSATSLIGPFGQGQARWSAPAGSDDPASSKAAQSTWRAAGGGTECAAPQRKTQIDVEGPHQPQVKHPQTAGRFDPGEGCVHMGPVRPGHDEPEVPVIFAQVGVIDAGKLPDDPGDLFDPGLRRGDGGKVCWPRRYWARRWPRRGSPDRWRRSRSLATTRRRRNAPVPRPSGHRRGVGRLGNRAASRPAGLDQRDRLIPSMVRQSPILCARAVKKMPDGAFGIDFAYLFKALRVVDHDLARIADRHPDLVRHAR